MTGLVFADMTSEGVSVPADVQSKAFMEWSRGRTPLSYSALAARIARRLPWPNGKPHPFHRASDRLIQKLRKNGHIEKQGRGWRVTDCGQNLREAIARDVRGAADHG